MDSAYLATEQLTDTTTDCKTEQQRPLVEQAQTSPSSESAGDPATADSQTPSAPPSSFEPTSAPDYPEDPSDPSEPILYDRSMFHSPTVEALVSRLHGYFPGADGNMVRKAYAVAHWAHRHQVRKTGDPYIDHPVAVASYLLDLQLDSASIAAALLHDVVEDTGISLEQVETMFGHEVAVLVDGVTKLSELETKDKEEARAGTYRKLFLAIANDPRVVLIKLSDRLHNMHTLQGTSQEQQHRVARETMEIYAPLAHRVGMWQMKSELEDLAFEILDPQRYNEILRQVNTRNDQRERTIQRMITKIRAALEKEGIAAQVYGRPKHIYSIYRKMERKGVSVDRIFDQLALRIILEREDVGDCYRVLGLVHSLYIPIMEQFDDYIAMPKDSHYQSLHTAVIGPSGSPCEVQIRTRSMHDMAEFGIAAHWRYKEGFIKSEPDKSVDVKLAWLRELLSWSRGLSNSAFMRSLKDDFLEEQIYVLTPKGRVIELPEGSTPVDFAYRIHSEVGHRCSGAKINGRIVPLDYKLKNSEIVEIMTSRSATRGPSRDWLNFVRSDSARSHIRRYFRRQERSENLSAGRTLLEKELKRLGLVVAYDEIAQVMNVPNIEHLFVMIGSGDITARTVAQKLFSLQTGTTEEEPPAVPVPTPGNTPRRTPTEIQVRGESGILTRLARCCNPVIGDPIVGFVTRGGKGVTVHRTDCRTVLNERDRDRLIDVTWGGVSPKGYSVPIRIETWDRVGLWADISYTIADAGINIEKVEQGKTQRSGRAVLHVTLTIQSADQFTRIIDKLNRIPDVIEARRVTNARRATRRN